MRQVTPKLYLGNVGEFGDANALQQAGIELAVLCHNGSFAHTAIPSVIVNLGDAPSSWIVKALAGFLKGQFGNRTMLISDFTGGLTLGAFLATSIYAETTPAGWNAARGWLKARIADEKIPDDLANVGGALWP